MNNPAPTTPAATAVLWIMWRKKAPRGGIGINMI
jgi:hypothetical protein